MMTISSSAAALMATSPAALSSTPFFEAPSRLQERPPTSSTRATFVPKPVNPLLLGRSSSPSPSSPFSHRYGGTRRLKDLVVGSTSGYGTGGDLAKAPFLSLPVAYSMSGFLWLALLVGPLVREAGTYAPGLEALATTGPILYVAIQSAKDAALKSRLNSATYKRINLTLALFGFLTFFGYTTSLGNFIMGGKQMSLIDINSNISVLLAALPAIAVGISGWMKGTADVAGRRLSELFNGVQGTLKGVFRLGGSGFGLAYLLLALARLNTLKLTMPAAVSTASGTAAKVFAVMGVLAPEVLVMSILLTLQDAASRSRLNATTFRHLNVGMIVSALLAMFFLGPDSRMSLGGLNTVIPAATIAVCGSAYANAKIQNAQEDAKKSGGMSPPMRL